MYKGPRFNHINHVIEYFKNWSDDMTDQTLIGGLLDKEEDRELLVLEIENYIRSIGGSK